MSDKIYLTKDGKRARSQLRMRIIEVMTNPATDGYTQKALAKKAGVSPRTLSRYLTDELWAEVEMRRLGVMSDILESVDKAVLAKAMKGDMTAAKIIYSRWEQKRLLEKESVFENVSGKAVVGEQTLEELNDEINKLERQIESVEKPQNRKVKGSGEKMATAAK